MLNYFIKTFVKINWKLIINNQRRDNYDNLPTSFINPESQKNDLLININKLKKVISKKDVCMANADEVKSNTGFSIGGVAPIAHLKKLNILIDQSLGRFQSVFAAAGHPNSIFKIEYNQLVQMTKGEVKEITEWEIQSP